MSLWRLEWLRLTRTRRWIPLLGVYLFFGLTGPLTARYLAQILERFGGPDMVPQLPAPTPADGITQYVGNAQQLGLLAVVIVAAAALAFDSRAELGVFLRTRTTVARILWPRFVIAWAAAAVAFVIGTAAAWYETVILLGSLPAGAVVAGALLGCAYLGFAVAVTALAAQTARSVLFAVLIALSVLIAIPVVGILPAVRPWLPSELVGAMDALVRGAQGTTYYLRALAVTGAATAVALAAASRLAARREL